MSRPAKSTSIDLSKLTVKELQVIARAKGVSYQCRKAELIERLGGPKRKAGVAPAPEEEEEEEDEDERWECDACHGLLRPAQVSYSCQARGCDFDLCYVCWQDVANAETHLREAGKKHSEFVVIGGKRDGDEFEVWLSEEEEEEAEEESLIAHLEQWHLHKKPKKPNVDASFTRKGRAKVPKNRLKDLTLEVKKNPCGLAVLIGNSNYKNKDDVLPRCVKDVDRMAVALRKLGFICIVCKDQTALQIKKLLFDVHLDARHKQAELFVVYFSGHGSMLRSGHDQLVGTDGQMYKVDEIIHQFNPDQCAALAGKPKLLFTDCCRGTKQEDVVKPKKGKAGSAAIVNYASKAQWWHLAAALQGHLAQAEHPDTHLSPFTHHLALALEGLPGGGYDLSFVQTFVTAGIEADVEAGKIDAATPNVHAHLARRIIFKN